MLGEKCLEHSRNRDEFESDFGRTGAKEQIIRTVVKNLILPCSNRRMNATASATETASEDD